MTERTPYLATRVAAPYSDLRRIPVSILLDNVRSMYNVGAFFRTADGVGCEKLYLCGITGRPPKRAITKTALGAEETVPWDHPADSCSLVQSLRQRNYEIAAVETSVHAVDLFDWQPRFPALHSLWPRGRRPPTRFAGPLRYPCSHPHAWTQAFTKRGNRRRGGAL